MIIFFLILGAAVLYDLRDKEIPNFLTFFGIIYGLFYQFYFYSWPGLVSSLIALSIITFLGGILWHFGVFGGGDHKLLMAVATFLGYPKIISALLFTALGGGVLALVVVIYKKLFFNLPKSFKDILKETYLIYSVPISIGTTLTFFFPFLF
jgi:prepilin peptidase CpaA